MLHLSKRSCRRIATFVACLGLLASVTSPAIGLAEVKLLSWNRGGALGVTLPDGTFIWPEYGYSRYSVNLQQISPTGEISQWSSGGPSIQGNYTLTYFDLLLGDDGSVYLVGSLNTTYSSRFGVSGNFLGYPRESGIYVSKYLSDGTFAWVNPSSIGGYDPVSTVDKDGNVIFLTNPKVKKITSSGSTSWVTDLGQTGASNYMPSAGLSTDYLGNVFVARSLGDGANRDDILISALNSSGDVTSSQSFPSGGGDVLGFYGTTLESFSRGVFVSTFFTGGIIVYTIDQQGLLETSQLQNVTGLNISSISSGSGETFFIGGDNCTYYAACDQRVLKFSGTSLIWDAYFKSSYPLSGDVMKEVHRVAEETDGSVTYSFKQLNNSDTVYRTTFPAPRPPEVVSSAVSFTAANADISGNVKTGSLKTSVNCLISQTSDFQSYQTVSAGNDLTSDGTYQCSPTNLQLGLDYFFKTVAENSLGISTSTTKSRTIPNVPSQVATTPPLLQP